MANRAGERIATIGFKEACRLWPIVVVHRKEVEFFCPTREVGFAAWQDEFDAQTGSPRSNLPAVSDS